MDFFFLTKFKKKKAHLDGIQDKTPSQQSSFVTKRNTIQASHLKFNLLAKQTELNNQSCKAQRLQKSSFSPNSNVQKLARLKVAEKDPKLLNVMWFLHNADTSTQQKAAALVLSGL